MLDYLILISAFLVNFLGFILIGILFQQITKYKLSLREWLIFLVGVEVILQIIVNLLVVSIGVNRHIVREIIVLTFGFYFSWISYKHDPKIGFRYHFFYGLYPITVYIILNKACLIIVQSLFKMQFNALKPTLFMLILIFEPFICYYLVSRWLNVDISNVRKTLKNYLSKGSLRIINVLMVIYHLIVECLMLVDPWHGIYNELIRCWGVFIYFILLFVFLFYLNFRHGQEQKNELLRNQEMELVALENYSKHVESLYQEVRSFRHDYANVLMSLKVGIDQGNLDDIKKIYEEITADSTKLVKNNKFDLTRLANITDSGVKSLMSAKFLQAENQGIAISLEVAEKMGNPSIPLISYIRILSILFDNAIEGALESVEPRISVANFYQDGDFVFMIENSTKEKSVDLSEIFERGYSTKGDNRGLGLATLMDFQDDYENLSVETRSSDYTFTQVVRIYDREGKNIG